MLFSRALRDKRSSKFALQDYNDIFSLVTVPNLFLTWYVIHHESESTDEITVTPELKEEFLVTLRELGIEFQFVVGQWGESLIVTLLFSG
jgi:hypothetical protein